MELADEIMTSMGMSDATPLSESKMPPAHVVGKNYENEELPEVTDEQREALINFSEGKVKELTRKEQEELPVSPPEAGSLAHTPVEKPVEKPVKKLKKQVQKENRSLSPYFSEMTTVGACGMGPFSNFPPKDPQKPKTSSKGRKNQARRIRVAFKLK